MIPTLFTIASSGRWSLGTLLGLPALILLIVTLGALASLSWWWYLGHRTRHLPFLKDEPNTEALAGAAAITLVTIVIAAVGAVGMYPYAAEYHQWRQVSGVVATTNSRFLSVDSGTDQKFVVTFAGAPDQQFGCTDTRCATVRPGDHLTITCKRSFQWFGTPGYDCNFVSLEVRS